jgi:hypothetical protein
VEDKNPILKAPDAPPPLPSNSKNLISPIAILESPDSNNADLLTKECNSSNVTPPPLTSKDVSSHPQPSFKIYCPPRLILALVTILFATFIILIQYTKNYKWESQILTNNKINNSSTIEHQIETDKQLPEIQIPENPNQNSINSNTEKEFFLLMEEIREAAIRKSEKNYSVSGLQNGKMLNIRDGPGMSYQVIGKIPNRYKDIKIVNSHLIDSGWVFVSIISKQGYVDGWVHASYLKEE